MQATAYQAGPWHGCNNQAIVPGMAAIFPGMPAIVPNLTAIVIAGDRCPSQQW